MSIPPIPRATQPQISRSYQWLIIRTSFDLDAVRSHQKDLFNVFHLREETENVLRAWFGMYYFCSLSYPVSLLLSRSSYKYKYTLYIGTRWLTRWDKEVELLAKLAYYGLTTLRGMSIFTRTDLIGLSHV